MSKRDLSARIALWAFQLKDFDYEVEHLSGTRVAHVDANCQFPVMFINHDSFLFELKAVQEQDDKISAIKEILLVKPYNDYSIKGDIQSL